MPRTGRDTSLVLPETNRSCLQRLRLLLSQVRNYPPTAEGAGKGEGAAEHSGKMGGGLQQQILSMQTLSEA